MRIPDGNELEAMARLAFHYAVAAREILDASGGTVEAARAHLALADSTRERNGAKHRAFVVASRRIFDDIQHHGCAVSSWSKLGKKRQKGFQNMTSYRATFRNLDMPRRDASPKELEDAVDALGTLGETLPDALADLTGDAINPLERRQHPVEEHRKAIHGERVGEKAREIPGFRLLQEFTATVEMPEDSETVHEIFIDWGKPDDVLLAEFKRLLFLHRGAQKPARRDGGFNLQDWDGWLRKLRLEEKKRGKTKSLSPVAQKAGSLILEVLGRD